MLDWIYKKLGIADSIEWENRYDWSSKGDWNTFSQKEFFGTDAVTPNWETDEVFKGRENGYLYLPENCKTKQCPVHFVFHGCRGRPDGMGD